MAMTDALRVLIVALACHGTAVLAQSSGAFHLDRLPAGKDVTIPRPATTHVPLAIRVTLTATDMPQSISLKPVNLGGGPVLPVRVSIYDPHQDRVKYVDVTPGTPFLYSFKELSSITVVPLSVKSDSGKLVLQVESDKPLTIAH
jgi:hypothetical protein